MIKVKEIILDEIENEGCNNGNYPHFEMLLDVDGRTMYYESNTCRCRKGCSNTSRLPEVGQTFRDAEEMYQFLKS